MKIFHIPLDILLLFIIPILVSIIAWARRHNCKYECVCIKKCKWYDMIWRCCCCCIEIIKCEYRAITIKWNRCKFNLSNVSIWINISKQDGNMYRSQPRLAEGYALKFENWNTSMHTLRERGLLPPHPSLILCISVLKFRALGVSFTGYQSTLCQLANSPSGITQFWAMSKQKQPKPFKAFFKCFPAVIPSKDPQILLPHRPHLQTNWIFKYERHF